MGFFVPTDEPGVLILGLVKNIVRLGTCTGVFTLSINVKPDNPTTRVNDSHTDRSGNYVFGTMREGGSGPIGSFYRFTSMSTPQRAALPHIAIANNIAFSPDGMTLHWCDMRSRRTHACDYDGQTGQVANIRVFADLHD